MAPETGSSHRLYDAFCTHFDDAWLGGRQCVKGGYPCR